MTAKQRAFVYHYLQCLNAAEAARLAGYSERTARQQGARLLSNVDIQAEIASHMQAHAMSAAEVLYRLTMIARGDMADYLQTDDSGALTFDLAALRADGMGYLLKRYRSDKRGVSVEFHNPLAALAMLAKHHNLTNRVQLDDWRAQAIKDIRDGKLHYDHLTAAFDDDLADQLFRAAGVPIGLDGENNRDDTETG